MPLSKRSSQIIVWLALSILSLAIFSCSPGGMGTSDPGGTISLTGAGSTFVNPLMQKWLSEYGKLNPKVKIDYQSIGSGGGIKQIQAQTVDFGASDAAMKDDDLKAAPGPIIHIPIVLGAVVVTYNLPSMAKPLHFSPEVIADIFLGKIKSWDDPRLKTDNAGVSLPAAEITVVHRTEGSATSAVFTDYLSKVSPEWKSKVGAGTSPSWPVGVGGKGNEGVTGQVKQTPNTNGYVELAYAVKNNLPVGVIKNKSGNFVEPSFDAVTAAAAESLATTPEDLRVSITDSGGANTYSSTKSRRTQSKAKRWLIFCGGEFTRAKTIRRTCNTRPYLGT